MKNFKKGRGGDWSEAIGSHGFFIVCLPIQPFVLVPNKQHI